MATNSIVKFQFDGDELEGVPTETGPAFPLRTMCEALGIAFDAQRVKLNNQEWATATMIVTVAGDGKKREMFCVDRRTLLMWLATIDANRVADRVRPKLVRYQKNIADTIDRVFEVTGEAAPSFGPEQVAANIAAVMREFVPMLIEGVGALVDVKLAAANEAHFAAIDLRASASTSALGPRGRRVLDRLRALAYETAQTFGQKPTSKFARSTRSRLEGELRDSVNYGNRPARTWANFPESRHAELLVRLEQMEKRQRQFNEQVQHLMGTEDPAAWFRQLRLFKTQRAS